MPTRRSSSLPHAGHRTGLAAWAVVPFTDSLVLANIDASLLYIMAITSMGVWHHPSGWASNSKYAFLGAMRSAAQMVSYEIPWVSLICVLMVSNSLNLVRYRLCPEKGALPATASASSVLELAAAVPDVPGVSDLGVAETNRAPFDVAEGESEIVAGFHVEYSGMAFAVFFLAEYANMILVAALTAIMFLGGWLSPVGFPVPDGIFVALRQDVLRDCCSSSGSVPPSRAIATTS